MYVKRVVIENLKGFKQLEFNFEHRIGEFAGWTVITGENAAGKTAFLKAIAVALVGPDATRTLLPSLRGWIKHGETNAYIGTLIQPGTEDRFDTGARPSTFWSEVKLTRSSGSEIVSLTAADRRRRDKKGPSRGPWAETQAGWFSAGYGPFRRLSGTSTDAQRVMSGPPRVARFATLFREEAALSECELWLKELNHKALENKQRERDILQQVVNLLTADFLRNGLTVERVDSDGLWIKDRLGAILWLADMSEGYRAALAMLIDILRHMSTVYPEQNLVQRNEKGEFSVPHPGVVIIDEIDAHLHPEWQRRIGFWLKDHFPRVQFIVSTHSPFICQAASQRMIFHLPPPGGVGEPAAWQIEEHEYDKIVAAKSDVIYLSPIFGMKHTRSPIAVDNNERYATLKAKQNKAPLTEQENETLKQLELFVCNE